MTKKKSSGPEWDVLKVAKDTMIFWLDQHLLHRDAPLYRGQDMAAFWTHADRFHPPFFSTHWRAIRLMRAGTPWNVAMLCALREAYIRELRASSAENHRRRHAPRP